MCSYFKISWVQSAALSGDTVEKLAAVTECHVLTVIIKLMYAQVVQI